MTKTCQRCGTDFEAKSPRAKWCSDRCRKAAQRGGDVVQFPADGEPEHDEKLDAGYILKLGPVGSATFASLTAAGRQDHPAGRVALALAARIDHPNMDTGSALASVARQHSAAMAEALKGAGAATAPGQLRDELAERRAAHGA